MNSKHKTAVRNLSGHHMGNLVPLACILLSHCYVCTNALGSVSFSFNFVLYRNEIQYVHLVAYHLQVTRVNYEL